MTHDDPTLREGSERSPIANVEGKGSPGASGPRANQSRSGLLTIATLRLKWLETGLGQKRPGLHLLRRPMDGPCMTTPIHPVTKLSSVSPLGGNSS